MLIGLVTIICFLIGLAIFVISLTADDISLSTSVISATLFAIVFYVPTALNVMFITGVSQGAISLETAVAASIICGLFIGFLFLRAYIK